MPEEAKETKSQTTRKTGRGTWYALMSLGLTAMILGSIQNFSCKTITLPQKSHPDRFGSLDSGPFSYRSSQIVFQGGVNSTSYALDICRYYSFLSYDLGYIWDDDPMTIAVRVFAFLAAILGALGLAGLLAVPCFGVSICFWRCYGILLLLAGICQGMSLNIVNSSLCNNNPVLQILDDASGTTSLGNTFDDTCQVYVGFRCGIAATVLWLFLAVCLLVLPAPSKWNDDWCSEHAPTPRTDQEELNPTLKVRMDERE